MYTILTDSIFVFILIFCRFGTAFSFVTAIGENSIPVQVRLIAVLAISCLLSVSGLVSYSLPKNEIIFMLLVSGELIIGFSIGVFMKILIGGGHTLGMVAAMQIGFSASHIYDPSQSTQSTTVGVLFNLIIGVLIVITDTHFYIIKMIIGSYDAINVGYFWDYQEDFVQLILKTVSETFNTAIKLSAPFIIIGLIIYCVSGVMARLMPQFQIFFLLMPLQIMCGLCVISFTAYGISALFLEFFDAQILNLWWS